MLKSSKSMVGALSFALVGGLVLILGILFHRTNEKHKYCHRTFPSGVSLKYCENSHKYAVSVGYGSIHVTKPYTDEDSVFVGTQYIGEREIDYVDTRKEIYITAPPHELQFSDSCSAKNFYFKKIYIRDSVIKAEDAILEFKEKQDSLNITNHCYK